MDRQPGERPPSFDPLALEVVTSRAIGIELCDDNASCLPPEVFPRSMKRLEVAIG